MDRAVHRAHACLLTASLMVAATLAADRSPTHVLQVREGTARLFQYDAAQPRDVRSAARDGVTVSDITYASPKGGVPAAGLPVDTARPVAARVRTLLDVMTRLAAVRYVPAAAPAPLFFQFARYEQNFPESAMLRYYAAASEPKRVAWYPAGHDLNDPQALLDRAAWLRGHLAIGPVSLQPVQGGGRR